MKRFSWCLLALVGCATPMSAVREDNRRLTQSVAELRADRRAQDRKIRDLEHQLALAQAKAGDVPQLPVEVVAPPPAASAAALPDGARIISSADDGTEIIYEGDAALGKPATLEDDVVAKRTAPQAPAPLAPVPASSDRIEVTHHIPPISASARAVHARPRAIDNDAPAAEYRAAIELVKTGRHDEAVAALRAFLQHYPRHDFADNAQYWLGESFYARKDYQHALVEFRATIEVYPRGNKVPDALLKVGYCYLALGERDKGRAVLEQVVSLYPKSPPAALAAQRLESP